MVRTSLNATCSAKLAAWIGPNGHLVRANANAVTCPDSTASCGSARPAPVNFTIVVATTMTDRQLRENEADK